MISEAYNPGQVNLPVNQPTIYYCTSNLSMWPPILPDLFNYAT